MYSYPPYRPAEGSCQVAGVAGERVYNAVSVRPTFVAAAECLVHEKTLTFGLAPKKPASASDTRLAPRNTVPARVILCRRRLCKSPVRGRKVSGVCLR